MTFEATALPDQTATTTEDAKEEGLIVKQLPADRLPPKLVLNDAEKIAFSLETR